VPVKSGRVIGFESGIYHSMTPVTSGRRCVLLMSFTVDRFKQSLANLQAETLLRSQDVSRLLDAEYICLHISQSLSVPACIKLGPVV